MSRPIRHFVAACIVLISGSQGTAQTSKLNEPAVNVSTLPAVTMTYLEQGEGDVVVFVHPQYTDHRLWEGQREAVAQDHRFIALDTRFHGTTNPWPEDTEAFVLENAIWYSHAAQITEMAEFIRQLDVGPVHMVGASRGTTLALNLALQYPELVRSLVLDSPQLPGLVTDPEYFEAEDQENENRGSQDAAFIAGDITRAMRIWTERHMEEPGNWDRLDSSLQDIFVDNSRTMLLYASSPPDPAFNCEQLGTITVPVTITVGRETRPTVSMVAEEAKSCIPNSQLVEIPDALLWAPANNAPAFNEALLNHLENPAHAWSANAMHHRGENVQRLSYDCPANGITASLWGTDIYSDDSSVCTAAVHAGLITVEQGGTVTIELLPGQESYPGSDRNGVTSDFGTHWPGSFSFVQ